MAAVNPLLDFQKIRLLGKGAFGVVYLAKHKASDEEVVIKIINTDNLSVKELQNSVQEGELLKMLDNPFIIKFKKLFQYKNTLSIIMEYADGSFNVISSGGDLSKKIKQANKRSFAEEQVMEWFCQILCAIKDIHSKNIIHRDIKSQNIFLTKEGVIKIGDFGVSTQTSSCASTVVGTPFYLSPEIINGAQYDSKTDIWSLGVLLYELCVLDYPFKVPNNSLAALALKILKGKFSPIPKQYSSDLSKLISTMLSVNPKSRPTIDQLMGKRISLKPRGSSKIS